MLALVGLSTRTPTDPVGQMIEDLARSHAEAESAQAALNAWMPWLLVALGVVFVLLFRAARRTVKGRDEADEDAEVDAWSGDADA
ncbi:hypothetical protein [Pedococcus bigeumensis]|uniref:Uncharacterized protein n=1 Tax=Pedococcus bigeumensis TaxID=433644 RepID=A0A502CM76_9MICO|nr:hypothetical protein [Pedococcus bigeumensis]TPG13933.1 hypothetical protein EAH86_17060 [Pedococcus bigeumensis]